MGGNSGVFFDYHSFNIKHLGEKQFGNNLEITLKFNYFCMRISEEINLRLDKSPSILKCKQWRIVEIFISFPLKWFIYILFYNILNIVLSKVLLIIKTSYIQYKIQHSKSKTKSSFIIALMRMIYSCSFAKQTIRSNDHVTKGNDRSFAINMEAFG